MQYKNQQKKWWTECVGNVCLPILRKIDFNDVMSSLEDETIVRHSCSSSTIHGLFLLHLELELKYNDITLSILLCSDSDGYNIRHCKGKLDVP